MAARVIDGKAVAAAVRERVRGEVAAYDGRGRPGAGAGDGARRRRPGLGDLRAQQAPRLRGGGDALGPPRPRRRRPPRRSCSTWSASLDADDDGRRHPRPAAGARADRPRRGGRRDRPGQGRRRPDPDQRRPARPRDAGPGALHAGRGDGAAAPTRGSSWRAPRRSSSGARSWSACRSRGCCCGANATVTVCHSRTRDLAATCRRADVLVAAVGVPRLLGAEAVKPGRGGDRRRHEPDRGRPGRRRRLRGRGRGRRRRSRRSRAASAR